MVIVSNMNVGGSINDDLMSRLVIWLSMFFVLLLLLCVPLINYWPSTDRVIIISGSGQQGGGCWGRASCQMLWNSDFGNQVSPLDEEKAT